MTIMTKPLHSECLDRWSGDAACRLLESAQDENGKTWPAGTVYQPLSGGADNSGPKCKGRYKAVTIAGQRVTFRFAALYRGM